MKYIDKSGTISQGHTITDHYLVNTCRVEDENGHYHYQNVDYGGSFGSTGAKDNMQRLALESQDNFCCYCMRDLSQPEQCVTLEHIIPQNCTEAEFNGYIEQHIAPLTSQNVMMTEKFRKIPDVQIPPRPHTVTFENIVASCDGTFPDKRWTSQCCNNRRGQKKVFPLFYVKGIEDEISYMQDGTMQPKATGTYSTEYRQTIENVRLNCQNLKDIRRLWHLFVDVSYDELVACAHNEAQRVRTLRKVLFQDSRQRELDNKILSKYTKETYWRIFLLYHWFHHKL